VSLKDARLARDAARLRVKGDRSTLGVDIVQEKRAAREEAKAVEIKLSLPAFEECAEIYIREHWSTWSKKHRNQWPSSLKRYAYPTIGKLTIPEIKPSHVYELLRPIWVEKRETANRVRGRIESIIAKNVDVEDTDFRNPAELTKQLREKLPRRPKRVVRHHPALPYAEAPQFVTDLAAAVPTKLVYLSSGPNRHFKLGAQAVEIKHAPQWMLLPTKPAAGQAVRALAWLGEQEAGEALKVLKRKLPESTLQELVAVRRALPPWMSKSIGQALLANG
jgi:hypothetical protein